MTLLERIRAGLDRDRDLPLRAKARKGARMAWSLASAKAWLAGCTKVGSNARTQGRPYVENLGEIVIGDDFNLISQFVASHLVTGPRGRISIGDDVNINYGAGICAHREIRIGDRVRIGPYAMILDTDFHTVGDHSQTDSAEPVVIGDDVWLANRVTVLKGASIGNGSVITAGSVVSGEIPAGVIAGGNPARVIRRVGAGEHREAPSTTVALRTLEEIGPQLADEVRAVFVAAFGLAAPPPLGAGSREVPGWDSLGHLHLLSALEARFGVTFGAEAGASLDTVGACVRWVDALRSSPKPGAARVADWPLTVHGALVASAERNAASPAVICDGRTTTYEALLSRAANVAKLLADRGVTRGEAVLVAIDDKTDFIAAYEAVVSLGAVAVPLHDTSVLATLQDIATRCGAKRLLCDRPGRARFGDVDLAPLSVLALEEAPRSALPLADAARTLKAGAGAPADPAAYMFTSGTTARKAVVLTHENLMRAAINIATYMGVSAETREYITVPLTHSFGWGRVRVVLSAGGTLVVHGGPLRAGHVVQAVEAHGCNALSAVPAGIALLSAAGDELMGRLGQHLLLVELGSAVMTAEQKRRLAAAWPRARICMHYGLTEASRSTFLDFRADAAHLDTVGRATPNVEVSVCDPSGKPLPAGKQGEIVIRGAHVAAGYLGDEERTAKTFLPGGGMRTADVGTLDVDGYLHFAGRLDEQINHGGMKVSPTEVEEALRGVLEGDYCVIGLPDPQGIVGELVTLVCASGMTPPVPAQLSAALAQKLEAYKVPRQVVVVKSLPRTANGKLQRGKLRDSLVAASLS